jgi:hypothetical protein
VFRKIQHLIEETEAKIKDWRKQADIKRKENPNKFHTPPGLFKEGTAQKIADTVSENYQAEYKTAMSRLNFFLNRGGRGVSEAIRKKVQEAKEIIKHKYNRNT